MTLIRRHPYMTASIGLAVAIVAKPMGFLYTYYSNLNPKLIFECRLDHAKVRCPEAVEWAKERDLWEFVPHNIIEKVYEGNVPDNKLLLATYESKIVRFVPFSFHAVKGVIKTTSGAPGTFYIYSWDKRYAPMAFGP